MASLQEKSANSALYGTNVGYLEDLAEIHRTAPADLPKQWQDFFNGATSATQTTREIAVQSDVTQAAATGQLAVSRLIDSYRLLGNRSAQIDPLQIDERQTHPSLTMAQHGLGDSDLDNVFESDIPGLATASLRDIIAALRTTYCGTMSVEFMHITDPEQRQWFITNYEARRADPQCSPEEKKHLLERILAADALENYLNTRFTGQKRFSLEGGDALIPLMDILTREALTAGAKEMCIGMAHRGRLNMLINVMGKNPQTLFDEFEGKQGPNEYGSGDIKYHKGYSSVLKYAGNAMHMALAFNPSHLEVVNAVVQGSVWARQARRQDTDGSLVVPVLIHGDAAMAGQGVVMEILNMSLTRGYSTGGAIHLTINNQIGFTTSDIGDARSTYWCTDIAKMAECPVLHVNGNDPEACALAARLALEYRNTFCRDVFINLVCFRRLGHSEQDEPRVTQPYMYSKIAKMPVPGSFYADKLVVEGVISANTEKHLREEYVNSLKEGKPANPLAEAANVSEFVDWSKHNPAKCDWRDDHPTNISAKSFKRLGTALTTVPKGFKLHSAVNRIIKSRIAMANGEENLDWGMAENLAYASLIDEGYGVRISGQDVGRGTFFHRHAVLHDQQRSGRDGFTHVPLEHIKDDQPVVQVINSLLCETSVLGFEYGVSLTSPDVLTVWEAQFGDFVNCAQMIIDQFISSGEFKWNRLSGLVMLLPHGYEGQGPEHSSARLERFMQLCAEYNMYVCVPSVAAQIFHLLRRQMIHPLRRPLIVMSPKSLLRRKEVASPMVDFTEGGFKPMIPEIDPDIQPEQVRKLIVCCGKVYYDLLTARNERAIKDVAIIRLEQVYPFPHDLCEEQIASYPNAKTLLWCQEEPGNQGCWHRVQHYLRRHMLPNQELRYSLRRSSASTATGRASAHKEQQQEIIDNALN